MWLKADLLCLVLKTKKKTIIVEAPELRSQHILLF